MQSKKLKDRILLLTYIYRTLPVVFLKTAGKDKQEKDAIRWTINNLIKQGYLLTKTSKPLEIDFIHLPLKGYTYVVKKILSDPKRPFYQYKSSRSLLKPVYNHSYLNFAFIWHYVKKNPAKINNLIRIYEDSDINHCKILFSYKAHDVLISPDVIIYTPAKQLGKNHAIYVENDTGRETYRTIFHKLIEYAALAEEGMEKHKLATIELYFIFLSKRRLTQLFNHPKGFLRFFDLYNKTNRGVEVRMRFLLKTLTNNTLTIYLSDYNLDKPENPYIFRKYDLASLLLKKEESWKNFL